MRWIIFILLIVSQNLFAQDLEQINLTKKDVYLEGNITAGMRMFGSSQTTIYRNSGFGYLASARLNLHVQGLSLPFSYRTGDQLSLPNLPSFKYWGFSPKYKAFQAHIGHRSLRFSNHTLAGVQTYGVGLTIRTKKLELQFSRGSLDRQRRERIIYNSRIQARKEKRFTAASLRLGSVQDHIKYSILTSKEKKSTADTIPIRQNIVQEIEAKKQFSRKVFIASNIAVSYVDSDVEDFFALNENLSSFAAKSNELLGVNPGTSSKLGVLYGGSIGYQSSGLALSLNFDHIDRAFETFGRNFQITDVRTYTLKNRLQFLNNSLLVNSRIGLQRNNLNDDKANSSTRWITNINVVARGKDGHMFTTNISNFNLEKENLYIVGQDSFSFSFNALTLAMSPQFVIGESRLSANFNFTRNVNERENAEVFQAQKMIYSSLIYDVPIKDKMIILQFGLNYSRLYSETFNDKLYGMSLGCTVQFEDRLNFEMKYNPNRNANEQEGGYMTHVAHFQTNYSISKKQRLFLSAYYQNVGGVQRLRENQIRFGYRWQFSTKKQE